MQRIVIALGAFVWLLHGGAGLAQMTGSWRPSPPNSKTIVYDEKGRRLFWDDNGQIVGRYSFATGRYIAELPGKQREEKVEAAPASPGEKARGLGIVFWGRAPDEESSHRQRPKVISGPVARPPTIVRFGYEEVPTGDVAVDKPSPPGWATSVEHGMP